MKKEVASTGGSVSPVTQWNEAYASTEAKSQGPKIEITTVCSGQTPDGVGDLGKKGGGLLHLLSGKGKKKEEEDSGGDASLYTFSTLIDKVPTGSIALPESEMTVGVSKAAVAKAVHVAVYPLQGSVQVPYPPCRQAVHVAVYPLRSGPSFTVPCRPSLLLRYQAISERFLAVVINHTHNRHSCFINLLTPSTAHTH
jgi:hypothetical protein